MHACPACGRDWTEGDQFCGGCGHVLPTTPAPAQQAGGPLIVATFGPTTGWAGRSISIDDQQFILNGHGPVTAAAILEYDRLGQLDWTPDAGLHTWVESVAAAEESPPAAPAVAHPMSTSPRQEQIGESSRGLRMRGPVSLFEWLSPEERRWLVEGIADTRTDRTLPLLSLLAEDANSSVAGDAVQAAARVRAHPRHQSSPSTAGLLPVDEAAQAIRDGRHKHQLHTLGKCLGNPTEHNVSVLTLLSSGSDDLARQARKALELLALWSGATPTRSSAGSQVPATSPQPAVVATFGPTTGWVGKMISYEDGRFTLEGVGPLTAADVLAYDRQGYISWAYAGMREWVQQVATGGVGGIAQAAGQRAPSSLGAPGIGVAGFVLSLLGVALLGLILSWAGLAKARRENRPTGLCVAGIVIGAAWMAIGFILVVAINSVQ